MQGHPCYQDVRLVCRILGVSRLAFRLKCLYQDVFWDVFESSSGVYGPALMYVTKM